MKRTNLPPVPSLATRPKVTCEILPSALAKWDSDLRASSETPDSIDIYGVIGEDVWTGGGTTPKSISAALKAARGRDVQVNINSPGGDMFDGLAIYGQLREYPGSVNVRVLGVAASAASIVAMAADHMEIARAGFLMIHNAHVLAAGNRHDFAAMAVLMAPFDAAMASVYAARTGDTVEAVGEIMDAETWIGGQAALDGGFADSLLSSDATEIVEGGGRQARANVARQIEAALVKQGFTRSQSRAMLHQHKAGLCDADPTGDPGMRDAVVVSAELQDNFFRELSHAFTRNP